MRHCGAFNTVKQIAPKLFWCSHCGAIGEKPRWNEPTIWRDPKGHHDLMMRLLQEREQNQKPCLDCQASRLREARA